MALTKRYRDAKLMIAATLARSAKPKRFTVANADDREGEHFLKMRGLTPIPFSQKDAESIEADENHIMFTWRGKQLSSSLAGLFNAYNILGAATCADALGISL